MPPDAAESLAAVKQLLPWWVPWGRDALLLIAAAVLTAIGTGVGTWYAFRPLRKQAPEHWPQRARLAHPGRVVARFCLLYFPCMFLAAGLLGDPEFSVLGIIPRAILAFVLALFVSCLFWRHAENRLRAIPLSATETVQSVATFLLLYLPHFLVALLGLLIAPDEVNVEAALVLTAAALLCGLLLNGMEIRIAALLGLARPADEKLQSIVDRAALGTGIPVHAVYEIRWHPVVVVAFPMSRDLGITKSAREQLADLELEAACRHKIGYLSESRIAKYTHFATIITICLCLVAARPVIGSFGYSGLLGIGVFYLVSVRLVVRLVRRLTERANTMTSSTEKAPGELARVVERMACLNLTPAVMRGRRPVEPHLYDRLVAAGIEPDFPRPKPPSLRRIWAVLAFIALLMVTPVAVDVIVARNISDSARSTESSHHLGLLSPFHTRWHIASLGYLRTQSRDWSAAATFFQAAAHLDQDSWHDSANLALVLIRLDRCAEAKIAFEEAEQRFARANSHRKWSDPAYPDDNQFLKEVSDAVSRCDQRPPRGRERRPGRRFRGPPEIVRNALLRPVETR